MGRFPRRAVEEIERPKRRSRSRRFSKWTLSRASIFTATRSRSLISPDNWNMDFRFMERPNARRVQLEFFYDYRTNVTLYPKWQAFLRDRQPRTIIFWGQDDIFFTREGGEAYLKDLPKAEMHRLDSGHFAVEDCLDQIASNIRRFYQQKVARE